MIIRMSYLASLRPRLFKNIAHVGSSLYFVFVFVFVCVFVFVFCICGISGIPDGVRAEESQFAAVLDNTAHLRHPEPMAQFCEDILVACVNQTSCSDLKGDVLTLEPVSCDGGDQLLIRLGLPLQCRRHVV